MNPSGKETIILMGPVSIGKTTTGKLLAKKLGCSFTSLDDLEQDYTRPLGYNHAHAMRLADSEGLFPYYEYRRSFFEEAVIQFLSDHQEGVLELGGGHPVLPAGANQQRVNNALSPFKNIFLLMPYPEIDQSLKFLRKRQKLNKGRDDLNALYFKDNTFFELAKSVIYTADKSPAAVVDEILKKLNI